MARKVHPLYPATQRRAEALGERLRLARLRRRMSLSELAKRVGVSRDTLRRLERGELSTSLSVLARTLSILGLDSDLDLIAADDELGHRIQDARLTSPRTRKAGSGDDSSA